MALTPVQRETLTNNLQQVESEITTLKLARPDLPDDPVKFQESYIEDMTPREDEWKLLLDQNEALKDFMQSEHFASAPKDKQEKTQTDIEQNKKRIAQLEEEYAKNPTRKIIESTQFQQLHALHKKREAITNELNGRVAAPTAEPIQITLASSLPLHPAPPKTTVNETSAPTPKWTGPSFLNFPSVLSQSGNQKWVNDFLKKYDLSHTLGSNENKMLFQNKEKNLDVAVNPNSLEFTCRSCNTDQMANMVGDLYVKVLEGKPRIDQHTVQAPDDLRDKVILKIAQNLQDKGLVDDKTMINDKKVNDILRDAAPAPSVTVTNK